MTDNAPAWDRYAATYQREIGPPTDVARYGPDIPSEAELRLLGELKGRRVLDLGCGGGQAAISFTRQGAITTGVDLSAEQLAYARRLAETEDVKVEFRQGDLADLAFLRNDSVDLVFSAGAFDFIEDLGRTFRQIHRVLKVGAPLVFSVNHPATLLFDTDGDEPLAARRSYFDRSPLTRVRAGVELIQYPHTFGDLYMGLARSSYRVEQVVEPEPVHAGPRSPAWRDAFRTVPSTLIIKARKEGN